LRGRDLNQCSEFWFRCIECAVADAPGMKMLWFWRFVLIGWVARLGLREASLAVMVDESGVVFHLENRPTAYNYTPSQRILLCAIPFRTMTYLSLVAILVPCCFV
jgi:hypothetical protein